jgi:hypothetical protein
VKKEEEFTTEDTEATEKKKRKRRERIESIFSDMECDHPDVLRVTWGSLLK